MVFVQQLPMQLLPSTLIQGLGVECYVRFSKAPDHEDCNPPASQPAANPAGAAGAAVKAKAPAQLRAVEAKARAEFGVATAILLIVSLGAAGFALYQFQVSWAPGLDRNLVFIAAGVAIVIGAVMACVDWKRADFGHALVNAIIAATMAAEALPNTLQDNWSTFVALNLFFAYVGASLLLVYLASLAIPNGQPGQGTSGIVGLQFGVLIGAAIFALGGYANRTGVTWATVALDEGPGAPLVDLSTMMVNLWGVANSAFMLTAIATAYYGIRHNTKTKKSASHSSADKPAHKPGPSALRTPDGDDFKALGWLVQVLIALAPIWLPAGLSKFVDVAKTIP